MANEDGVYITQDTDQAERMTKMLLAVWDACRGADRDELIASVVNDGGFVSTEDDPLNVEDLMLASLLSAAVVLTMEHLQVSSTATRWVLFSNTVEQRLTFIPTEWLVEAIDAIRQRRMQNAVEYILDERRN